MTGRGRSTRAGARAEAAASLSPQRRSTRQTPASEDGGAMPPPPAPQSRAGRASRGQSKTGVASAVAPSGNELSLPSQIAEGNEEDAEGELTDSVAIAEQLRGGGVPASESGSLSVVHFGDGGASQVPDSQDRYSQSRRVASTPGRSDIYVTTPGGSRAKARVLLRLMRHLQDYADAVQELLYNYVADDAAWQLEYRQWYRFFSDARDEYQRDGFFINAATIIANLDVELDHPTALKAFRTVAMANIASLLADIHSFEHEALNVLPYVQAWDDAFPSKFLPLMQANQAPWTEHSEVIDLALRLRIQRTIYTLEESGGDAELMSLVDAIWIDPRGLSPRHELLAFLSGNDDGVIILKRALADISLGDERYAELRSRYIAVVRQLYSAAAGGHVRSAIAQLKQEHPIEPLMKQLRKWSFGLFREILKGVDPARGSTMQSDTPSVMASQIDSQVESQVDPRMYAPPEARPATYTGAELGDLQQLRALEAEPSQSPAMDRFGSQSQAQMSQSPSILGDNDTQILQRRHELMPSSAYPPPGGFAYRQSSPTPGQRNNGIHFAHSAAVAASSSFAGPALSSTSFGKRPRSTQDSDDPFEIDDRQPGSQRRAQVAETPRPRKRARPSKKAVLEGTPGAEGDAAPSPRRPPPASAMEPDLEALSQRAREVAIANRKPKEPQTRTPWSRNDCRALIKAVDVYKAKWSLIQQEIAKGVIPFEHPRDQQALRDKARLLKQDMLKTDMLLPPAFDLVVMGKKERQAVIAAGKNPDRSEDDIDDNDNPTNTVYLG